MWFSAGISWASRLTAVAAQLMAVRMLTTMLGLDSYGAFSVLAGITGWFMLADFSIPFSMQNFISERRARGKSSEDVVLASVLLMATLGLVVAAFVVLFSNIASDRLLNHYNQLSLGEKRLSFMALGLLTVATAVGNSIYRIWFAQHRAHLAYMVPALATLTGVAGIWVVSHVHLADKLAWSIAIYYTPTAMFPLAALIFYTARHGHASLRVVRAILPSVIRRASKFWVFAIFGPLILQIDYIILSQTVQASDIVIYNVTQKFFMLIFFVYTTLLSMLWPICAEAIVHGRWEEVLRRVHRYILFGVGTTLFGAACFAVLRNLLITVLVPHHVIHVPISLVASMTIYYIVRVWTDSYAVILQSMNDLRVFWKTVPIEAMLSIIFQILGAKYYGVSGLVAGLTLAYVATIVWAIPQRCFYHARMAANKAM